jgi:DNA-directed RNA polymerase alpha subunit
MTDSTPIIPPDISNPIASLNLKVRAHRALESCSATTIASIANVSATDLLGLKNCGTTSLAQIRAAIAPYGIFLKGDATEPF